MGKLSLEELSGDVWVCNSCHTHLAYDKCILSTVGYQILRHILNAICRYFCIATHLNSHAYTDHFWV